ncbi:MAG: tetratricopeptide repeat protein [Chloroflexi bacterium]|nr:tetratricopeptide repeat protein [Chloroflexota bacterium]
MAKCAVFNTRGHRVVDITFQSLPPDTDATVFSATGQKIGSIKSRHAFSESTFFNAQGESIGTVFGNVVVEDIPCMAVNNKNETVGGVVNAHRVMWGTSPDKWTLVGTVETESWTSADDHGLSETMISIGKGNPSLVHVKIVQVKQRILSGVAALLLNQLEKGIEKAVPTSRTITPIPTSGVPTRTGVAKTQPVPAPTKQRMWTWGILGIVVLAFLFLISIAVFQIYQRWQLEQQKQELYQSAVVALSSEQWENAQNILGRLISIDSNYRDAQSLLRESYYRSAMAHMKIKEWEKAQAELQTLIKLDTNYRDVQTLLKDSYYNAGISYLSIGNKAKAQANFMELLRRYGNFNNSMDLLLRNIQPSKLKIVGVTGDEGDPKFHPFKNIVDGSSETFGKVLAPDPQPGVWAKPTDGRFILNFEKPAMVTLFRIYIGGKERSYWINAELIAGTLQFSDSSLRTIKLDGRSGWHDIPLNPILTTSVTIRSTEVIRLGTGVGLDVIEVELYGYQ